MFGIMEVCDKLLAYNTHIEIPNYNIGDCPKLEEELSIWNKVTFSLEGKGYYYDEYNKTLCVPRSFDINILKNHTRRIVEVVPYTDKVSRVSIGSTAPPRDDIQVAGIQFLLGTGKYSYTNKYSQLALNLPPGTGKTFMTISAIAQYRQKAMVLVHNVNLIEQWANSFLQFTDMIQQDIVIIQGSKMIDKLLETPDRKMPGKIYIASHRTLSTYGEKNGYAKLTLLFDKLSIGIKVFDEAHLEFTNMVKIDSVTNVKRTFYLTATYDRSSIAESMLFNKCFGSIPRFSTKSGVVGEKHLVHVTAVYNTHPTQLEIESMKNMHGFNKNAFSDYSIRQDKFFESVNKLLEQFIKKTEGIHLVLVSKKDACVKMEEKIKEHFPDKTVVIVNSDTKKDIKEHMGDYDIIVSTPKSLGTGVDLPGLRSCINTEPYSSRVLAEQISGRLRPHKDGGLTYYVETIDDGFKRTRQMLKQRMVVFKNKCLKLITLNVD